MGKTKVTQSSTVPETAPENMPHSRGGPKITATQANPSISDKLDQVLAAIDLSRVSMEERLGTLTTDISLIRDDHRKLADRVVEGEKIVADLQPTVKAQQTTLQAVLNCLTTMEERMDNLEGSSRRCNIRVLGLPEGIEGSDPVGHMETWVKSFTPATDRSAFFSIERAHRVPARRPQPGAPPWPMLAKFLHFRDRNAVLRGARQSGPLQVENKQIMIFPDYARAVQQQRSVFLEVKRRLRANNIQYSLLFPARLKVLYDGATIFFTHAEEAHDWADQHCPQLSRTEAAREQRHRAPRPRRHNSKWSRKGGDARAGSHTPDSPDLEQIMQERRDALRAVAELQASSPPDDLDRAPHLFSSAGEEDSDGTSSRVDSITPPQVTPQTDHIA